MPVGPPYSDFIYNPDRLLPDDAPLASAGLEGVIAPMTFRAFTEALYAIRSAIHAVWFIRATYTEATRPPPSLSWEGMFIEVTQVGGVGGPTQPQMCCVNGVGDYEWVPVGQTGV